MCVAIVRQVPEPQYGRRDPMFPLTAFGVIAPDKAANFRVISKIGQVVKGGALKVHPLVTRLVDRDALEKMGAERLHPDEAEGAE